MKKILVIIMGLFFLSITGICWATTTINDEVDNVQFEERVIYGDRSVIDGVTVHRKMKWKEYMYWDSTYTFDEVPMVETKFDFYGLGKSDPLEEETGRLEFFTDDGIDSGIFSGDVKKLQGMYKALSDLNKEAPAGETTQKEIFLKDYTDYYQFAMMLSVPDMYYHESVFELYEHWDDPQSSAQVRWLKSFNEFFRIPVLEDEIYYIGVNKNEDGALIGYGYTNSYGGRGSGDYDLELTPEQGDVFNFDISLICTEDTVYFTFFPYTYNGNLVDTSLIPGGYGIYSFKYDSHNETIQADSLKTIYSMDPSGYVMLEVDEQQENLLIFSEKANEKGVKENCLTVVNLESGEEVQTISYGKINEETYTRSHRIYDDFLVAQYDYYAATVLSRNEDGTYNVEYKIPGEVNYTSNGTYFFNDGSFFDWNGSELLVVNTIQDLNSGYWEKCSFYLAAFDKTGLIYYGEYDCSLDSPAYSGNGCSAVYVNSISVKWK